MARVLPVPEPVIFVILPFPTGLFRESARKEFVRAAHVGQLRSCRRRFRLSGNNCESELPSSQILVLVVAKADDDRRLQGVAGQFAAWNLSRYGPCRHGHSMRVLEQVETVIFLAMGHLRDCWSGRVPATVIATSRSSMGQHDFVDCSMCRVRYAYWL